MMNISLYQSKELHDEESFTYDNQIKKEVNHFPTLAYTKIALSSFAILVTASISGLLLTQYSQSTISLDNRPQAASAPGETTENASLLIVGQNTITNNEQVVLTVVISTPNDKNITAADLQIQTSPGLDITNIAEIDPNDERVILVRELASQQSRLGVGIDCNNDNSCNLLPTNSSITIAEITVQADTAIVNTDDVMTITLNNSVVTGLRSTDKQAINTNLLSEVSSHQLTFAQSNTDNNICEQDYSDDGRVDILDIQIALGCFGQSGNLTSINNPNKPDTNCDRYDVYGTNGNTKDGYVGLLDYLFIISQPNYGTNAC